MSSSSIETTRDATELPPKEHTTAAGNSLLSLFDQLKNSVDHNSVTKTSLATLNRDEKIPSKSATEQVQDTNISSTKAAGKDNACADESTKINVKTSVAKPEFHAPKLLPPPSGTCAISGLGAVSSSAKRANSGAMKLHLKPPTSNIRELTSLRSLKRSQQSTNNATQKTGTPQSSTSATIAGLLAATSGSSSSSTTSASGLRNSLAASAAASATDLSVHNAKKKRCTDRYDSSESSDSGVATSLSCTDSSTGSSEDASEPGSPFSLHSSLSEDHHLQQQHHHHHQKPSNLLSTSHNKMSPQTILVTSSSSNGNQQNSNTGPASSASSAAAISSSASLNAAIRTSNLPASLTITPTSGGGTSSHSGNTGANKTKLPSTQIAKSSITANANRSSNLPTLQWPWSTTTTTPASSTIPPPSSSSSATPSSLSFSTSTTGTNTHPTHTASNNTISTTIASNQAKKRTAPHLNSGVSEVSSSNAKKSRSNVNIQHQDGHHVTSAAGAKRLKAAALEESQTKITGYFKSQMKAQMQAANNKMVSSVNSVSGSNIMMTTTSSSANSHTNTMATNALTMSAPATTASLNKYFNILAQLKENSKAVNNTSMNCNTSVASAPVSTTTAASSSVAPMPPTTATTTLPVSNIATNLSSPAVTITSSKAQNLTVQPVTMPALKKIERPKPTKIAQVAPNLRKTPSSNSTSFSNLANGSGKSPAKKHVAIAPRTPEMKQQQQQNQLLSIKQENVKQSSSSTVSSSGAQATSQSAQQPAVLLTAIRLPQGQQQTTTSTTKPTLTSSKITPSVGSTNTNSTVAGSPVPNTVANAPTTLYQLPAVQLPNLVQLPHLLAANGANLMQLNNMASMAKTAVSSTTTSTTAATSATSAQAAQAAAAQYFLNGTVFKLQQFTTATTTTSTAATTGNGNPFNLLSASDLQDMLIKQQQQQQQLQQMQQQQKAAVANATATSFQEIFQQQIAAAIAANQQQQQQAQLQQLQRLGAAASIQQQPVFMATPAGLLLNAASLPAMLAQAAAALAVNTQQQQQQHQKAIALPALQPIQQTPLPALSSIFAPQAHQQTTTDQHEIQQQQQLAAHLALAQQQFISASQPPPLSSVTLPTTNATNLTHNSNHSANIANNVNISNNLSAQTSLSPAAVSQTNTAKLAIVKANAVPPAFTTLSSQPPPLVTISNAKSRANLNTIASSTSAGQKTSVLSKPYQKRSPKVSPNQSKTTINVPNPATKTNAGKITTSTGKIIASPTTPPPLVPTLAACAHQPPLALASVSAPAIRSAPAATLAKPSSQMPTPALVSIAPTNTTPVAPKPVQSITCGSVTITPTSTASTSKSLVNIAPKVSATATNMQVNKLNSKPTATAIIPPAAPKAKAKTTASDLFDLVKNSNGAISITPAPATSVSTFNSTSNFSAPLNFSASAANFKPSMPLEDFGRIKDEPIDDIPAVVVASCNTTNVLPTAPASNAAEEKSDIKHEPPTSFSGQIPTNCSVVKEELASASTEEEESEKSCSPQPNIMMNNESSSSSFSCHSNSVSSAADLSLEASTPASITSSSEATSPGCSMLSPLNTSSNQFAVPNPCSNSNSVGYSTSSNSCETAGGASSRDMLSEMVTSTCVSSDTSESSISVSLPDNDEGKQAEGGDVKSIDEVENESGKQRDLPTPESGIGGSLSNTESMDSSSKSSNSETASSAASSTCEQEVGSPTSDSQTPPPTPMAIDSSTSMEETQNESITQSNSFSEFSTSAATSDITMPTIDTVLAEVTAEVLPKCAISPILSQPKTIRFPANKGNKRHDGICYWDKCNKKHESNSKLLDHMQQQHVNSQTGPFSCLWVGCKVYNKESCSRRWLERHVLSHGGSKQFKCIVEGCGLRFGSQLALQKHVNNHFSATENKESTSKRTSDPPVPKQLRKNGKKLRYRRQPFSARMFDFFDAGIMEGLQHRLRQISTLTNGCNSITFQGQCIMKRKAAEGATQCYVQWSPKEIISDEWIPECEGPFLKTVNIKQMKPAEKNKVESLLMTAYKLPYSSTIFENDYALSRQHETLAISSSDVKAVVANATTENSDDDEEDDDENDDDEDEDDTATTSAETISSYQHVLSITNIQMQQRRKHPRKPQSRITVTR